MKFSDIKYLSFEGGGGKGIVYLGAIQALQNLIHSLPKGTNVNSKPNSYGNVNVKPNQEGKIGVGSVINMTPPTGKFDITNKLVDINKPIINLEEKPEKRQIQGVAGASAGAINAFLIAMGFSANEINDILRGGSNIDSAKEKAPQIVTPIRIGKYYKEKKICPTERFFSQPDLESIRMVKKNTEIYGFVGKNELQSGSHYFLNSLIKTYFSKELNEMRIKAQSNMFFNSLLRSPIGFAYGTDYGSTINNDYLNSLYGHMGLFTGIEVFKFFEEILQYHFIPKLLSLKIDKFKITDIFNPANQSLISLNFRQLYALTGVDLVISGTNISHSKPVYFSAFHTPDFPVIPAVAASMNIPFIFKPIYIDYEVNKINKINNKFYKGLYVDGGMLNNFPLHAFDNQKNLHSEFISKRPKSEIYRPDMNISANTSLKIATNTPYSDKKISPNVFGLRVGKETDPVVDENEIFKKSGINFGNYLGGLFETFFFPSESGQIRNEIERKQTISLLTRFDYYSEKQTVLKIKKAELSLFDFTHPEWDLDRGLREIYDQKFLAIQKAKKDVTEAFLYT